MRRYAYYNGKIMPYEDIRIPLCDRSIYFGDAVYEAMIGRGERVFLLSEHLERLSKSAKRISVKAPCFDEIERIIRALIKGSHLEEYFIYIQLSRASSERRHEYREDDGTNLLITISDFRLAPIDKRLSLICVPDIRYMMCDVKTVNLLPAVLASGKARECGADEAVFHRGERITECAHSNISIIKDSVMYTHPTDRCILPGITRAHLISAARRLGVCVVERPFTRSELFSADDVIVSSTSKLCLLCDKVDSSEIEIKENSVGRDLIYEVRKEFFDFMREN